MKILESHLLEFGVEVKYGNRVVKLLPSKSSTTSIHFENGVVDYADIIIGAVATSELGNQNPSEYKPDLLALFNEWPSPIKTIINETPLSNINKIYVHDHNPMEVWHRDNVLVIGDAAHAPLPTSEQGACQAIEDAWHLAELLEKHDGEIESVFQIFTKICLPKTTSITMGARQFASSLFSTDENASRIRNENSKNTDYKLVINGMAKGWSNGLPIYA